MTRVKHICPFPGPFPFQSVRVPLVVMRDGSEQGDRQGVEIKLFQDAVDQIGLSAVLVDPIECVTCRFHRQCWDVESLTGGRNGGDTGCEAEADVADPTQFLYCGIDLLGILSLWVENGFSVIEE